MHFIIIYGKFFRKFLYTIKQPSSMLTQSKINFLYLERDKKKILITDHLIKIIFYNKLINKNVSRINSDSNNNKKIIIVTKY